MASGRPGRGWLGSAVIVAAGLALVLAASGCATVPTGGTSQPLPGSSGPPAAFVQPLPPPPPGPVGWSAQDVVEGFLHASASFDLDPAALRAYLAPGVKWQPGPVIVVSSATVGQITQPRFTSAGFDLVGVTVTEAGMLNRSGQYTNAVPGTTGQYQYTLARYDGTWLIKTLPPGSPVLLYDSDFQQVFQPRNLYFFADNSQSGYLVPDPVDAAVQAPNSALSSDLVKPLVVDLMHGPPQWLTNAAFSAFPTNTKLLSVTVSNLTAIINLGGAAADVYPDQLQQMYAQLSMTLTKGAYSPPVADSVQLEVNGQPVPSQAGTAGVPQVGAKGEPLSFAAGSTVRQLPAGALESVLAAPALQIGSPASISAIAVSRGAQQRLAVAVPDGGGCEVEVGTSGSPTAFIPPYRLSRSGGQCNSLSWDSNGNLWAVADGQVWFIQPGANPVSVQAPGHVLALRMAPDGLRAAMVVQTGSGNQLLVAAVGYVRRNVVELGPATLSVSSDAAAGLVFDPAAFCWYSPYDLAVLSGSDVYEVPLSGSAPQPLAEGVPAGAVSLTTNGYAFAVGTTAGKVEMATGNYSVWRSVGSGGAPAFPG